MLVDSLCAMRKRIFKNNSGVGVGGVRLGGSVGGACGSLSWGRELEPHIGHGVYFK